MHHPPGPNKTVDLRLFSLLALLGVTACEGPKGDPGDPGADGTDGTDGTDGADGTSGADGADGTDGADGASGTDGADGADGAPGWDAHQGDAPWGVVLTLLDVRGGTGAAGQLQIGDTPVVTYTVTDDDGVAYDVSAIDGISFQLSGPNDHYQIAVDRTELSVGANSVWDPSAETWTYTFDTPIPATYHAVPNDTTDLGEDDGDWGGLDLEDGTYTLAAWAYVRIDLDDGSYYYDADNATADVLLGAATELSTHEVVLAESCASCHGEDLGLFAHGGSRRDLDVCLTCHVAGAEDRYSSTDSTTTPGATINMSTMVHKIHMGEELSNGYVLNGYPADADGEGYPDYNAHDYSEVVFPAWAMGPADCATCHDGAADADPYGSPTRATCGSCHDAVDFETGDGHDGGAWTDDSYCSACHTESAIEGYHADPRTDSTITSGLNVEIISVSGGSGDGGALQAGDTISVTYSLTDSTGAALTTSSLSSATAVFAGPLDHMQWILESSSGSVASASVLDSSTGYYTYSFTSVIPSTVPAQKNNTDDIGYDQGDWYGLDMEDGTYRVAIMAYRNATDDDGTTWRVPKSSTMDVLFGGATELETRDVVTEEACTSCHQTLEFHGKGREGLDYCVMCHTAGGEDRNSSTAPDTTPGVSIEMSTMIHKIHMGEHLTNTYDVIGFSGTSNFNEVVFPRFDGGPEACTACHGDDEAYLDPSTKACTSCHDSTDAAAHAAVNTDDVYGEACDTCHGEGRDYAVTSVHDWAR